MLKFTELERAVFREICDKNRAEREALEAQIKAAVIGSRENTGAGFYTRFEVDRSRAEPMICGRVLGNVWAKIESFLDPMTFQLFVTDGYATCLEGAAIRDGTLLIDFGTIKFEILAAAEHAPGLALG